MTSQQLEQLKYPIGQFEKPAQINQSMLDHWIQTIELFPERLEALTRPLNPIQLNWVYRPKGWTIKQVVHHCADSHMNSLMRLKLALTEDEPEIKPYYEDRWAELPDALESRLEPSYQIIRGVHARWIRILRSLKFTELKRTYYHPEHGRHFTVEETVGIYAWHANHHLAHIRQAVQAKGKFETIEE